MNVLFIGDPHLKINRFDLAMAFLAWLNKLIAEHKPDLVVNLGDTFDTHAVLRSEVMNEFMKHVYHVIDMGIPYVYVLGNHDMHKPNDAKYHALLPFKNKIKNFYVVDSATNLFDMTFVPYQHNPASFPRKTLPIVVAHQTFVGADYGVIRDTTGVDKRELEGCELVISGHIHKRQMLVAEQTGPSVLYVGSPFSQSASDVDQVKGISIIDTSTRRETFVQTPMPSWRRLCFMVSKEVGVDTLHAMIKQDVSGSKDHWVIELEGPKAEIVGYLGSAEYRAAIDDVDVKIKTKFTDSEKKKVSIEAKSMEHILSEFVVKVYNGSIDKQLILGTAKKILDEARTSK